MDLKEQKDFHLCHHDILIKDCKECLWIFYKETDESGLKKIIEILKGDLKQIENLCEVAPKAISVSAIKIIAKQASRR